MVAFPNANVTYVRQPNKTGDFEVTSNGTLVHSKKGGEGWPFDQWPQFLEKLSATA